MGRWSNAMISSYRSWMKVSDFQNKHLWKYVLTNDAKKMCVHLSDKRVQSIKRTGGQLCFQALDSKLSAISFPGHLHRPVLSQEEKPWKRGWIVTERGYFDQPTSDDLWKNISIRTKFKIKKIKLSNNDLLSSLEFLCMICFSPTQDGF